MKIKLKAEKKKLLGLIRTRTPQNLLLSLEIGRGLGIERWVECAWVREFEKVSYRICSRKKTRYKAIAYSFIKDNKVFFVDYELILSHSKSYINMIDTNIGVYCHSKDFFNLYSNDYNFYSIKKLRSLIQEWFVNYIKYILPHEL